MSGPNHEEELAPPTFRLPENPDRFELWTVRLPRDVDPADLNGCHLQLNLQQDQEFAGRNGKKYTFQWGDPVENESFRLLLPKEPDDDDSDDDDDRFLYPTKMKFQRHVKIAAAIENTEDVDLAPSAAKAPPPVDDIRHAYASIPQRKGLKRRWTPLGGPKIEVERTTRSDMIRQNDGDTIMMHGNGCDEKDERPKKKLKSDKVESTPSKAGESVTAEREELEKKDAVANAKKGLSPKSKKEEATKARKEEAAEARKADGVKAQKDEGAKVTKEESANVKKDEGAKVQKEDGTRVKKDKGAKVKFEESATVKEENDSKVKKENGSKVKQEEGVAVKREEGAPAKSDNGKVKKGSAKVKKEEGVAVKREEGTPDKRVKKEVKLEDSEEKKAKKARKAEKKDKKEKKKKKDK
jgi:hypothetical protein